MASFIWSQRTGFSLHHMFTVMKSVRRTTELLGDISYTPNTSTFPGDYEWFIDLLERQCLGLDTTVASRERQDKQITRMSLSPNSPFVDSVMPDSFVYCSSFFQILSLDCQTVRTLFLPFSNSPAFVFRA